MHDPNITLRLPPFSRSGYLANPPTNENTLQNFDQFEGRGAKEKVK